MMALILPIALLQLLVQPVLLESPRWYAMYGNEQMAEEMLVLLRDRSPDDPEARARPTTPHAHTLCTLLTTPL